MEKLAVIIAPFFAQITKLFCVVSSFIHLHNGSFSILPACFL